MKYISNIIIYLGFIATISSCKKHEVENLPNSVNTDSLKKAIAVNYANIVYVSYYDSYDKALELKDKIETLIANPTDSSLNDAKQAWILARVPYLQTEAYRFSNGPIDDANGPEEIINSWPIDESYIDYVAGNTKSGIINDSVKYPQITEDILLKLNLDGGATNVSTGYHAIEFLLWGQDFSATSAGTRPFTDFSSAPNAKRRGQYLLACTNLLIKNLTYLIKAWAPNSNNYRAGVEAKPDIAIQNMLLGIGSFTKQELVGERLLVAYETQLQENEQSCFSDNTDQDIKYNALGIENVFYGRYIKQDGSSIIGLGISDLLKTQSPSLNTEMISQMATTKTAANNIQKPFDQDIISSSGRQEISSVIESLTEEANLVIKTAVALGYTIAF